MSVPLTGNYKICNVHYDSNQVFDLQVGGHNPVPPNPVPPVLPIVGRRNAKFKSYQTQIFVNINSLTQMGWTLQVVGDAATEFKGCKVVRLINVKNGTYAQPKEETPSIGEHVVGAPKIVDWLLAPTKTIGQYSIQTPDGEFACALLSRIDYTAVQLEPVDDEDPTQMWKFCPI
uniref:Ricin B lectin domain-containing protein n=1 Tax=Suillus grevillei TaxID=5382 RepID=I6NT74_SUIGR|nr:hypothetical protein [Suillus grevillei]